MAIDLDQLLAAGVVVLDGAMGTLLQQHGIPHGHPYDFANLTHPAIVQGIHAEYVAAGAHIIETNTYGANRFKLSAHGLGERVAEINAAGARLARQAAEGRALVAGSVGPIGRHLAPVGKVSPSEAAAAFAEQVQALLEGGVDLFVLETFTDLEELRLAVDAVRAACALPILAHKTFIEDGETLAEGLPRRVVAQVADWGLTAFGANCTVGPQRMLTIVQGMAEATTLPLSALPTAGLPQIIDGHVRYDATPEYFAHYGRQMVEAGARLVGGCCGTTPAHIKALAQAVRGVVPGSRRVTVTGPATSEAAPARETQRSRLADKLGRKYVVTVELDVPRGLDMAPVLRAAEALRDQGCDCIDISDGARARLRMNPMVVARQVQELVGIEVMEHFACRDRNLLAIQADLLGAHALGLRNILAITGDPAQIGDYPTATSVFDVDSIGLVRILRAFNEGVDLAGTPLGEKTAFLIAVAFNPLAPDLTLEVERLRRKADEGAHLIYTQPIYELGVLERAAREAARVNLPLLVGVLPLRSSRHAEFFHNEVPGITIPEPIRRRLATLEGDDARRYGVEQAQAFLREARSLSAGVYIMPPALSPHVAGEVMEALEGCHLTWH
ncbi:MAG: bifunctional homocysteine S-methyltransferase/methylenetetrahydrofolate reductase [Armatimonadetes bacterium]|nr:bifunctional homocysteine S-methyltransferase/methylenetetrahydrofolate reductase [Armatimonadota bacterium]